MASTNIIADVKTLITNGASVTTKANSIAAAGPIMDYPGNLNACLLKSESMFVLLTQIQVNTSNSDDSTNRTLNAGVLATLNGTSSPSTTLITSMKTVYNNGPSATTKANSIAAGGPIMDYLGNVKTIWRTLEELFVLMTSLKADTSASDDATNLALINGILAVLV